MTIWSRTLTGTATRRQSLVNLCLPVSLCHFTFNIIYLFFLESWGDFVLRQNLTRKVAVLAFFVVGLPSSSRLSKYQPKRMRPLQVVDTKHSTSFTALDRRLRRRGRETSDYLRKPPDLVEHTDPVQMIPNQMLCSLSAIVQMIVYITPRHTRA